MYISDKDNLFFSKLEDAVRLCQIRMKPYFFPFLSERKQAISEEYLKRTGFENYFFYGGYEQSERKMLALCPHNTFPDFPVSAIEFRFRSADNLTHRDFLGSLMSLGIERETIGDILVENGRAVVFAKSELRDYIVSQIYKVGKIGVKAFDADLSDLPQGMGVEELLLTVTSMRLDNIVAAVTGLSREKTKNIILSGNVSCGFIQSSNISREIKVGDTLIIRGKGKYILQTVEGQTKKGRLKIRLIHFR